MTQPEEGSMAKDHGSSIKDDETYEKLRDQGASKEKAARIANAASNEGRSEVGSRGGQSAPTMTGPSTTCASAPRSSTSKVDRA